MPNVKNRTTGAEAERAGARPMRKPKLTAAESTTMTARVPTTLSATYDAISLITQLSVGSHVRAALEEYVVRHWSPERLTRELAEARRKQEVAKAEADALAAAGLQAAVEALAQTDTEP